MPAALEDASMSRTWLSISVQLVSGHGEVWWPRPGRVFAAARRHTFRQFATAIDDAFARWDRAHLHIFTLADRTMVSALRDWGGEEPDDVLDGAKLTLNRLKPGEQFAYVFDLGDDWAHLCTVAGERIEPFDRLGIEPDRPMPYWGWGDIPDQYQRQWDGDDGESPPPPSPGLADLPPILPGWGQ
jgi:hypothetical protein